MSLSRKHFEKVAQIFGSQKENVELEGKFADYFFQENPRFDRGRFFSKIRELRQKKKGMKLRRIGV